MSEKLRQESETSPQEVAREREERIRSIINNLDGISQKTSAVSVLAGVSAYERLKKEGKSAEELEKLSGGPDAFGGEWSPIIKELAELQIEARKETGAEE